MSDSQPSVVRFAFENYTVLVLVLAVGVLVLVLRLHVLVLVFVLKLTVLLTSLRLATINCAKLQTF
jgi:hypothetical protein